MPQRHVSLWPCCSGHLSHRHPMFNSWQPPCHSRLPCRSRRPPPPEWQNGRGVPLPVPLFRLFRLSYARCSDRFPCPHMPLEENCPVADYAIDLHTQAHLSDWNSCTQCNAFVRGLAPYIKHELVSSNLLHSLDGFIELTSRLDSRMQIRRRELCQEVMDCQPSTHLLGLPATHNLPTEPTVAKAVKSMQAGRTSLTLEEQEWRHRGNLFLYCGMARHCVSSFPVKGGAQD